MPWALLARFDVRVDALQKTSGVAVKSFDAMACLSKESIRGVLKSQVALPGPKSRYSHLSRLAKRVEQSLSFVALCTYIKNRHGRVTGYR